MVCDLHASCDSVSWIHLWRYLETMTSLEDDQHEDGVVEKTPGEPLLSESLVGLFGAFDKLKETMGYSEGTEDENVAKIQLYAENVREENEMLRQHAEDAITMAQRYKEAYDELAQENAGLYEKLTQASVNDMVMHTKELSSVAYDYDREVLMTKMAQAEEMVAHAYEMQQRLEELEEENEALKQTLHEIREDQKQLHILRQMDDGIMMKESDLPSPTCESPALGSPTKSLPENGLDTSATPVIAAQSPAQETTPVSKIARTPDSSRYVTPMSTMKKDDPLAIAEALASVAGGSESGMAASASKMLRGYHTLQSELEEVKEKNEALVKENQELTETMTSKQFKAPSAWAEREVKYKLERKEWEDGMHAKEAKIVELEKENEILRSDSGTDKLNKKIIDLEAQLVVLQRECENSKAALHDMQVSSMLSDGEFSMSGVKRFEKHDHVHSIIDKIESESESHEVSSNAADVLANREHLEQELKELQIQRQTILTQISDIEKEGKSSERVKCEIALLENGVGVDVALKIVALEEKIDSQPAVDDASIQEEISTVSSMLRNAFKSAEARGDSNATQAIQSMHVMQYVKTESTEADEEAIISPAILTQEVQDRINQLQIDVQESGDLVQQQQQQGEEVKEPSMSVDTMPQGMKPQAAAALAAANRAHVQDIEKLKIQLREFSKREAALKEEIGKARYAGESSEMKGQTATSKTQHTEDPEEEYRKAEFTAVRREKAEIEAKFDMTKMQLAKSQEALDAARQEQASLQKAIKIAIATGDLANVHKALNDAKSSAKNKSSSPLKKMRGKGIFSMRKNSGSRPGSGTGEQQDQNLRKVQATDTEDHNGDEDGEHGKDSTELKYQLSSLKDENDMLMDQLVTAKVRLAEVEGSCLQSKRALVRAKEKQMELARQLHNERASKSIR